MKKEEYLKILDGFIYQPKAAKFDGYINSAEDHSIKPFNKVIMNKYELLRNGGEGCCFNFCSFFVAKGEALFAAYIDGGSLHVVIVHKNESGEIVVSDPARDLMASQGLQFVPEKRDFERASEHETAVMKETDLPEGNSMYFEIPIQEFKNRGEFAKLRIWPNWVYIETPLLQTPCLINKSTNQITEQDLQIISKEIDSVPFPNAKYSQGGNKKKSK